MEDTANASSLIPSMLVEINHLISKVKNELKAINEIVKESGELSQAAESANTTLMQRAKALNIDLTAVQENIAKYTDEIAISPENITNQVMSCIDS